MGLGGGVRNLFNHLFSPALVTVTVCPLQLCIVPGKDVCRVNSSPSGNIAKQSSELERGSTPVEVEREDPEGTVTFHSAVQGQTCLRTCRNLKSLTHL